MRLGLVELEWEVKGGRVFKEVRPLKSGSCDASDLSSDLSS